jgi:hypothetical protein
VGAEVQLFVNDGFYSGRRHAATEFALPAAEEIRARLTHAGWIRTYSDLIQFAIRHKIIEMA